MTACIFATALLLALAIDHWWGEPPVRWHPVVWMGNYLAWAGHLVQLRARQAPLVTEPSSAPVNLKFAPDYKDFWLAALMWCAGATTIYIATGWFQQGLLRLPDTLGLIVGRAISGHEVGGVSGYLSGGVLAALLLGLALKPMLAWAMLRSEVRSVEAALSPAQGGSLAAGRERLSWLVSREVAQLTETQVRESAIETLAENLNDSVVAPIFWFVLLGLPGAAVYRFANTADAMWGYRGIYKGQNWEWAGKWAAYADDVLSWLPARITALLLLGVSGMTASGRGLRHSLAALRTEAARTPSPNSGWPMAAMALKLGVCLHKPGVYALNATGRVPQAIDTEKALKFASKALVALVIIAQTAIICIAFFWGNSNSATGGFLAKYGPSCWGALWDAVGVSHAP